MRSATEDDQKIKSLYRAAFQRAPDRDELLLAKDYFAAQKLATNSTVGEPLVWQYGYGAFDEATARVKTFKALPHFKDGSWQGGKDLPDAKVGWVILNAEGGHAGDDAQRAAIRRWRAPRDGAIKITGRLVHSTTSGDGVRGRIVSSANGQLGEWVSYNTKATTNVERVEVKRGDTIDFVTDCRASVNSDSFTWAPTIRYAGVGEGKTDEKWNAKADFSGPRKEFKPLTPWERYAQALLLSNELMFVD